MKYKKLFLLSSACLILTPGCATYKSKLQAYSQNIQTSCEDTGRTLFAENMTFIQKEEYFGQNIYHKNFNWKLKILEVKQAYAPPDSMQYNDILFEKGFNVKFECGNYYVDTYVYGFAVDDQVLKIKKGQVYNVKGRANSYMNFGGDIYVLRADVSIDDIQSAPVMDKKQNRISSLNN